MRRLLHLLEPEEFVGAHWHRLVGSEGSWPRFPDHAVALSDMQPALGIFFRGVGGRPGLKLAATVAQTSSHRLRLRQRIGLGQERLTQARGDDAGLYLPRSIDAFPASALNRDLYLWLAAYFACARAHAATSDPLHADLAFLAAARSAVTDVIDAFPGLGAVYHTLCQALLPLRPARRLPATEQAVEAAVLRLLGTGDGGRFWPIIAGDGSPGSIGAAPKAYRPFVPVPLWGAVVGGAQTTAPRPDDEPGGDGSETGDERVRAAERRPADQTERNDSLILNRMEKLLSLVEQLNINRTVDDDDEEAARKALEDTETISVSRHTRRPATKLKFDLDIAATAVDDDQATGEHLYPEWDYARRAYRPDYCCVTVTPAPEIGESWKPDAQAWRRIHRVRRQFEALRPRPVTLHAQIDGAELDIEAVVRARTDLLSSGIGSDRVHLATQRRARDFSVCVLVDASLSSDAWVANRRVLDIAKEALFVLSHGLTACGDEHAVLAFSSQRRAVTVSTVKDFDEALSDRVQRRIFALRPGHYTRLGTAVRHATARLRVRPHRYRLLLVLTDGKPNDMDHYEGRYGVEDTARAVHEARRQGLSVFGVTIDRKAQSYFPVIFGRGGYNIVGDPARLPMALPALYRHLITNG